MSNKCFRLISTVLIFSFWISIAYAETAQKITEPRNLKQNSILQDVFIPPELGTFPLPPEKEMAYPYPDGVAKLKVDFPSQVQTNEEFNISVTYQTNENQYCSLFLFHQLYVPSGTNLPTSWRQVNTSPWDPSWNSDKTGSIESLPSVDWVDQNWNSWFGVGVAPMGTGSLIMHSNQSETNLHNHYFWASDGDSVTITYGPFSFNSDGNYLFEIMPTGWYWEGEQSFTDDIEPISFEIEAVGSQAIEATVDIKPDSLNLRSKGKVVTAYIELPDNLDPRTIDISSLRLENAANPLNEPTSIGDYDKDGIEDLMVKFNRSEVIDIVTSKGDANLSISGQVGNQSFLGADSLKVIN